MYYNICMSTKLDIKTVRLTKGESGLIAQFLKRNPFFEGFSSLARVAILDLISKRGNISLSPIVYEKTKRPSFLWDYDLTDGEIHEILSGTLEKRRWLVARILEHSSFDEIWKYLTIDQIERDLPKLRLLPKTMEHWELALKCWRDD